MKLFELKDKEIVLKLLEKECLYKSLCNVSKLEDSYIDFNVQKWFALVEDSPQVVGLFIVTPGIGNTLFYHGGVYKQHQGTKTVSYLRFCLETVSAKSDCIWMTAIPEKNKAAIRLAKRTGLEYKTTIPGGYRNDNMLIYSEV